MQTSTPATPATPVRLALARPLTARLVARIGVLAGLAVSLLAVIAGLGPAGGVS